jgi:transposase-like protein
MMSDQASARLYFEVKRWPGGVTCPACGEETRIYAPRVGIYRCNACVSEFTVRTGTILDSSKVPLHKWLCAMCLLATAQKGMSSTALAKQVGVTQKTAWFMLRRLREACGGDGSNLSGAVEADEANEDHGDGSSIMGIEGVQAMMKLGTHGFNRLNAIIDVMLAYRRPGEASKPAVRKRKNIKVDCQICGAKVGFFCAANCPNAK